MHPQKQQQDSRWTWDALVALEDLDGPGFWESFYRAWKSQTRAPSSTEEMLKRGLGSDDPTPKRFDNFGQWKSWADFQITPEILAKGFASSSQGKNSKVKLFANFTNFVKLTLHTSSWYYFAGKWAIDKLSTKNRIWASQALLSPFTTSFFSDSSFG